MSVKGGKREGAGRKKGSRIGTVSNKEGITPFGFAVLDCSISRQDKIINGKSKSCFLRKNPPELIITDYVRAFVELKPYENPYLDQKVRQELIAPIAPLIEYMQSINQLPETKVTPEEETTKKSLSPESKEILEKYPNLIGRDNK